jgi:LysR family transcriptional activator of nhaA
MHNLNYHHLHYFWTVARVGSITEACEELSLAPSTVSGQIQKLEESLGQSLFKRSGRNLVLTEFGHHVYRYAEDIFSIGRELVDFAQGRAVGGPVRLDVGVTEVVPKLVVKELFAPVLDINDTHITVREGHADELLSDLALHHLDVVITDSPVGPDSRVRAFNHLLMECDAGLFAAPELAADLRAGFPDSFDGAPLLLPTQNAVLRRLVEQWFESRGFSPRIVGEFQDAAQLKSFGQAGFGAFPAAMSIADEIERQYNVECVGKFDGVRERFYAISVERKVTHPAVVRLLEHC